MQREHSRHTCRPARLSRLSMSREHYVHVHFFSAHERKAASSSSRMRKRRMRLIAPSAAAASLAKRLAQSCIYGEIPAKRRASFRWRCLSTARRENGGRRWLSRSQAIRAYGGASQPVRRKIGTHGGTVAPSARYSASFARRRFQARSKGTEGGGLMGRSF